MLLFLQKRYHENNEIYVSILITKCTFQIISLNLQICKRYCAVLETIWIKNQFPKNQGPNVIFSHCFLNQLILRGTQKTSPKLYAHRCLHRDVYRARTKTFGRSSDIVIVNLSYVLRWYKVKNECSIIAVVKTSRTTSI